VRLSKELTAVAASALQKNMMLLGPLVLPFSEKFLFAINLIRRKLLGNKKLPPYTPDFTLAFEHICIHSGEWALMGDKGGDWVGFFCDKAATLRGLHPGLRAHLHPML
jgi:3-ketoacyl-CoA synthase